MYRVLANRFCVHFTDGSNGSLGRVGRAHDLAIFGDSIIAFQHLNHDGPRYHEIDKLTKEWALTVHGIEFLSLTTGNAHSLLRDDAKTCLLDDRIDGAGQVTLRRVGFEDRKSALDRHRIFLHWH